MYPDGIVLNIPGLTEFLYLICLLPDSQVEACQDSDEFLRSAAVLFPGLYVQAITVG